MQSTSVSRFWDKYIVKTIDYGINQKRIRWYVIHAQPYIKHYCNTRLQAHEAVYLEKYLTAKHSQKPMQKWRYQQIRISLKIRLTKMVQQNGLIRFHGESWRNSKIQDIQRFPSKGQFLKNPCFNEKRFMANLH